MAKSELFPYPHSFFLTNILAFERRVTEKISVFEFGCHCLHLNVNFYAMTAHPREKKASPLRHTAPHGKTVAAEGSVSLRRVGVLSLKN